MKLCLATISILQGVFCYAINKAVGALETPNYIFYLKISYGISMILVLAFLE